MSDLPARPSLSHLRKQAKHLLRELQRQHPGATLAEAQHTLARRYGFASWPKLKAHVEAHADVDRPPMFHRYTGKAREAVFFSRCEASEQGSETIEPQHVLLGSIRASSGLPGFDALFPGERLVRNARHDGFHQVAMSDRILTGQRARQVLRAAADEADAMNHPVIGLVHILLGVMRDRDVTTADLLDRYGLRMQAVREAVAILLEEERKGEE